MAIRIIKKSPLAEMKWQHTCPHCGTVFENEYEDIVYIHKDIAYYVVCPFCACCIGLELPEEIKKLRKEYERNN